VSEKTSENGTSERIGLHNLKPSPGSRSVRKRLGRGKGTGFGKTAGRGHKGAGARSGSKRKAGYEGGQNPIHMRMGKLRGPNNKMSMPFENFRTRKHPVKVLGNGDISAKLTVKAHAFSASAKEKIEAAGGSCEELS
jgi:large subunit ribosomal protein L15